jgi:hypothetical protein
MDNTIIMGGAFLNSAGRGFVLKWMDIGYMY